MTAEYVAFHAAERPDGIAIVNNGRSITYAEFARDIRKFTRALRALGLPQGSKAVIDCDDAYFNWLLRLAFERLRVVTATIALRDAPGAVDLVRDFDIVLSGEGLPSEGARRHHPATSAWLERVLASGDEDEEPAPEQGPDDPIRIMLTSGTTGRPKKLLYTRRVHDTSIAKTWWFAGFTQDSRYLLAMRPTVAGPTACVRAGGTVVIEERMPLSEAIAAHAITHTTLLPLTLRRVLDELPAGFAKPSGLTILSLGAGVSRALRARALAHLATEVADIYGSNEAGLVSSTSGAAEIGTIWPGTRVEVVDEQGAPLPFGVAGEIRVQTDYMLHGYLDDPEATGRMFKDGWFYGGDIGILRDARHLQVIGRSDEVLNIGGRKIAPEAIEELLLKSVEADDIGACSLPTADGIEEIYVAVTRPRCGDEELVRRITDAVRPFEFGRFHVLKVAGIPRTPNGKLQRVALKEGIAQAIQRRQPAV